MAKIPFDIKYRPQIESGKYKVFAYEHEKQEARIVCWDNKGEYPIVALIDNEPEKFDKYGRVPGGNRGEEFSLFIVTPEELTEFERTLKSGTNIYVEQGRRMEDWDAKADAKDLMEIARKELQREIDAEKKEDLRTEYEKCRADALKDLPDGCW